MYCDAHEREATHDAMPLDGPLKGNAKHTLPHRVATHRKQDKTESEVREVTEDPGNVGENEEQSRINPEGARSVQAKPSQDMT